MRELFLAEGVEPLDVDSEDDANTNARASRRLYDRSWRRLHDDVDVKDKTTAMPDPAGETAPADGPSVPGRAVQGGGVRVGDRVRLDFDDGSTKWALIGNLTPMELVDR